MPTAMIAVGASPIAIARKLAAVRKYGLANDIAATTAAIKTTSVISRASTIRLSLKASFPRGQWMEC
ncbi:hypothetical protein MTX26_18280 [Bradyrhizobium sp. ISRA443]|uniref:hypothetical protein n=1 Tax=unclassified Bradyrhizobium TaxID=2631580 RepID=UPI002479A72B|nr:MULTISPECIES: hypothetical protein [unclassified Bradyrhizobium]WGS03317.1 hypothetical protein MTX18_18280 [Bradyrhizobium sp. ISRA437]WGS10201.1 hypothetical protein MTX26_18280 [Bradyrhizobium sp. ISRA443]